MPNKSGIEAAREIRARDQDSCHNIPIIAVSADDSDRNQDQCQGVGINYFMSKPVNIYDLKQIVEGMI